MKLQKKTKKNIVKIIQTPILFPCLLYFIPLNATLDQTLQVEGKLPIITTLEENAAPNQKNVAFTRGFNKKNLGM